MAMLRRQRPDADIARPVFARIQEVAGAALDEIGMAEHRRSLVSGLSGRVLEIGAGTGLTFRHYPATVTGVVAVEPEPRLRAAALRAAADAAVPVTVLPGRAERLPAADGAFDVVVSCQVLCSVRRCATALHEIGRVLRPGGRLRFLEHVRAEEPRLRRRQRLVDATVWPLLNGGCHTARDIVADMVAAGFSVAERQAFVFPAHRPNHPASRFVLGTAQRTGERDHGG